MRAENDNEGLLSDGPEPHEFGPSATSLFAPTVVIALGYGTLLLGLLVAGTSGSALARLCLAVLALAVPALIVHAALRYFTVRVRIGGNGIEVHCGFPDRDAYQLPLNVIRRVDLRTGLAASLTGSGTLIFELANGQSIVVKDVADSQNVKRKVDHLLTVHDRDGDGTDSAISRPVGLSLSR